MQQGLLTEEQLRDFLKVQVSEILYDCFVWPGGTFAFIDGIDLPPYAVTISIDLSNLIMEGARRIEEWEECVRLLPDSERRLPRRLESRRREDHADARRVADPLPHQRPAHARRSRRTTPTRSRCTSIASSTASSATN